MNSEQQYIDLFLQARDMVNRHSAPAMNALREQALEAFRRQGFPTQKVERYKYTNVSEAFAPDYGMNLNRIALPVNPYDVFKCDVPNLSTSLYFVVNDGFYNQALPAASLPEGVEVCSLAQAARERPEWIAAYYGKQARSEKDAINALNTLFAQDGLLIHVPKGVVVERPIQVVNILRSDVPLMVNRRVLVVLEEGAQARLLMCDHAIDRHQFLATQVQEVFLGQGASLELYELEESHEHTHRFSNLYVEQAADSHFSHTQFTLTCGLTRNRTDVVLAGEHAEVSLHGAVVADARQHVDNNTLIDHRACYGTSNELYKYVLDDSAVGAFAGRVLVRENAQHSVSNENNANLCATRRARMYTQPMLEIYADDVKCSHGSTVGQLDEQALFYMRQRGISLPEARMLLKLAFVGQVVDTIALDALRDRLHYLVEKRFRGELHKCEGCKLRK